MWLGKFRNISYDIRRSKASLQREENFSNLFLLVLLEKGNFAIFLGERAFLVRSQDLSFETVLHLLCTIWIIYNSLFSACYITILYFWDTVQYSLCYYNISLCTLKLIYCCNNCIIYIYLRNIYAIRKIYDNWFLHVFNIYNNLID